MRNGGPTAACRPRPGGPQGRDAEAVREYEETFTTVNVQSGLARMMSRVPACLFTTDAGSLTASELAQHLQASPASLSKAIAFLESQGLVRRERDERRRERYAVDDGIWYQSMTASARSTAQLAELAIAWCPGLAVPGCFWSALEFHRGPK